jgi:signal transduction histidine kinase
MPDAPRNIVRTGSSGDVAFAIVVCFSYLAMITASFESLTSTTVIGLMVIGTLYTLIGIYGYAFIARHPSSYLFWAYFTVQILLSGLIVTLGKGAGFNALLMLPLAGQAVVLLPPRGVYATSIGILMVYIGAVDLYSGGLATLWNNLITFLAGLVFVVVFTQLNVEQERARGEVERLAQELEEANRRLREYAIQAEELATTRERNRLAREIHDGVGHYLTTVFMQIQAAEAILDSDRPRAINALDKAKKMTQAALTDVRRSVASLRSPLEQGGPLSEVLASLVNNCRAPGLRIEFKISGSPRPLSPQVELTCFRTTQEGLNNVQKHAHTNQATVHLDYSAADRVRLSIEDDGSGSDDPSGGFGLLGLRERVHLVDGEMYTETAVSKGFTLTIEVPG